MLQTPALNTTLNSNWDIIERKRKVTLTKKKLSEERYKTPFMLPSEPEKQRRTENRQIEHKSHRT